MFSDFHSFCFFSYSHFRSFFHLLKLFDSFLIYLLPFFLPLFISFRIVLLDLFPFLPFHFNFALFHVFLFFHCHLMFCLFLLTTSNIQTTVILNNLSLFYLQHCLTFPLTFCDFFFHFFLVPKFFIFLHFSDFFGFWSPLNQNNEFFRILFFLSSKPNLSIFY